MNVFLNETIAKEYDSYYETPIGRQIDLIEKEAIATCLSNVLKQPVLELGCGTGHWSMFLSEMGYNVVATDISEAMLAIAKSKDVKNVQFQKADASCLPFSPESFETVVSITMLEFTDNTQDVLNEIYRVLKPNGYLILGCLNVNSELGKEKNNDEAFRNAHFFSKSELFDALLIFGIAKITECVYLSSTFEILDGTLNQNKVEGVFLATCVQKTK